MKKIIALLLIVMICVTCYTSCALAYSNSIRVQLDDSGTYHVTIDDAVFGLNGTGNYGSVFYVYSFGDAEIEFEQTKGSCSLLSYTKLFSGIAGTAEEWGKYKIRVFNLGTSQYSYYDWDDTYWNGSKTIELPSSGLYYVYVRPFTNHEMTDSYWLDQFAGWTSAPEWWIESFSNCHVYATYPGTACY